MRRTVATLLLVSVLAVPLGLSAGLFATGTAAAAPSLDPGSSSRESGDARMAHLSMAGRGTVVDQESLVEDHRGPPFVWASESLSLRATVHTDRSSRTRRACARLLEADGEVLETADCTTWNSSSRYRLATMQLAKWPAETSGAHYVRVDLFEAIPREGDPEGDGGSEPVRRDTRTVEVYVLSKQGDLDGDGLANAREVAEGTDFTREDTDGDGLSDRAEVYQYGSDPLAADTTGDGIEDGTIASMGLPPTVPYAVHAAVVLLLLGVGSLAYATSRLRRVLASGWDPATGWDAATYDDTRTVTAVDDDEPKDPRSSKEREILAVLREHGGRMRQTDLVDETEWSKATVSRLLSTLEDDDRIEKIRVGRGNVVQLIPPGGALDEERSRPSG